MLSLIKILLEDQKSGGEKLYHFTTLLDGLQIVNPNTDSLLWSQAARTGDGTLPFFSLTSKESFTSGYPLIQKNKALIAPKKDLEDLKIVRISFDKDRLESYTLNPFHYEVDQVNQNGSLRKALEMIEDPNDRDEAEIRITRQNRKETLQALRDSIVAVDILVEDWIYKNFTKQLKTQNKFEGLVRSYFDKSQNAFLDVTYIVTEGKRTGYWQDKKYGINTVSGHKLMHGLQFPELRTQYGYSPAEIKQLGHLVAYCNKILPSGALHYFDSLSADEISAIGAAAEESPGNADAARNAFRTLNIQNKFKGSQKIVLKCILALVDDFEEYLKKEGVLNPNQNYSFQDIVDTLKQEGWIQESFNLKNYLQDNWLLRES